MASHYIYLGQVFSGIARVAMTVRDVHRLASDYGSGDSQNCSSALHMHALHSCGQQKTTGDTLNTQFCQ